MNTMTPIQLRRHLQQARTIAVVGISDDVTKASHYVSAYMQSKGYLIIPINPKYALRGEKLLGEICYAKLGDIPTDKRQVDIVNCFRKTEDILPIAKQAIEIHAKGFWQQVGIDNQHATQLTQAAGLWCISNQCLMVEHRRLIG